MGWKRAILLVLALILLRSIEAAAALLETLVVEIVVLIKAASV